jgi:transposase
MLGLDLELAGAAGALMIGGGTPLYVGKHARPRWIELVRWLVRQGAEVHVVQEACGFGWEFHRQLQATGATSRVVAPQEMSGKRKTDRRDASALCMLLWDQVVRANLKSLRVVSVPTAAEQQRRGYHRSRSQWLRLRNQVEAQGRSLMWDHGWLEVPKGWWRPKLWSQLKTALEAAQHHWLVDMLGTSQSLCLVLEQRITVLKTQAVAAGAQARETCAATTPGALHSPVLLPKGLGELTYATLQTEVRDWKRFRNRGQAGSFIGCCPREHSSGPRQKLGEIDRMGSKRLRTALVEAVWRLNKWNPGWRGLRRFAEVLGPQAKASGARKRKAIVACARLLMIDLWRLHVGTATLEGLGLQPAD